MKRKCLLCRFIKNCNNQCEKVGKNEKCNENRIRSSTKRKNK